MGHLKVRYQHQNTRPQQEQFSVFDLQTNLDHFHQFQLHKLKFSIFIKFFLGGHGKLANIWFPIITMQNIIVFGPGSCGGAFTDANGHMSSPSYPNNYPPNEDCIYTISQPSSTFILLNFYSMEVEYSDLHCKGCCDYLEIRDGPLADSPLLEKLCGNEIPAPIHTSQGKLWMK